MKESHSERLAIHTGPESCGVVREDSVEALSGGGAGRVLSRQPYTLRSAAAFWGTRKAQSEAPLSRGAAEFRAVGDPSTLRSTLHGNREVPRSPIAEDGLGRIGKSEDVRR